MKKNILLCAAIFTASIAAEKEDSPLDLMFVGVGRVSQSTKFDGGNTSATAPKGTTTEFSSADYSLPFRFFSAGKTWGGYVKANITINDALVSGSGTLKTTDKATGQLVETDQGSTPLIQYQSPIFGLPAKLQGGALYTIFDNLALGVGLQISGIGIKQQGLKTTSAYSLAQTGELALNLQAVIGVSVFELFHLYINPSFSVGTMGSADFMTKALYGEGADLGKGTVSGWEVMVAAKIIDHILLFVDLGNDTRVFNKSLPAAATESRITTSYLRLGAGYAF